MSLSNLGYGIGEYLVVDRTFGVGGGVQGFPGYREVPSVQAQQGASGELVVQRDLDGKVHQPRALAPLCHLLPVKKEPRLYIRRTPA